MKGLCGWFGHGADEQGSAGVQAMLAGATLRPEWPQRTADGGTIAGASVVEDNGSCLAVVGRPRLREGAENADHGLEILRALRSQGREALARIEGDFALAFWDSRSRRGLLAVDRIGIHQLVHGRVDRALVFASTLDLLTSHRGITRRLAPQGLFDYLFYHVSPGPDTVFEGLRRLPPGCCIVFDGDRAAEPAPYWTMRFDEDPTLPLDGLKSEFIDVLQSSVKRAADAPGSGAFLSGGTDSSTVSGMLQRVQDRPARTFSIGFDVAGYDEMSYARIAAKHFGCEHHEYYVTPDDVVDAVPRIAAWYDQPFGNASAIPTYYCAKVAKEAGIARMLAGDGGDELFGGNERYGKHYLLSLYGRVPAALRRGLLEPVSAMPFAGKVMPLRKLASYIKQASPPMPERYASYNLLMHLGNDNVFTPEFLASIDTDHSHRLLADAHAPFADASLINQMQGIDLRFTLWDGDLPKVTRMCEMAGVDVAFPLLDDRVVAFSAKLASDLKLRRTTLRWFFKEALRDFLPQQVITKQKHGFGLPVGAWLTSHAPLRNLAADGIDLLRQRGIVRPTFIDDLMSNRLREHAAYFGTMVWVLMMLGLWLQSRRL
jgi:asparagine synthase (glutamine-hydrolysing)